MMRFLLLASAGFAAAESDHVSLLQTAVSKSEQHVSAEDYNSGKEECNAAKAKSKASRAAMKELRAAMKAARAAFKAAKETYKTDKAAVADACPRKTRGAKPCAAKGFEEQKGYVDGTGRKVELIPGSEAGRIGSMVFKGDYLKLTEGERQNAYHKMMCEAIKPEFCGGSPCPDRRSEEVDPTCELHGKTGACDPRGRPEGKEGTHYHSFYPGAHFAFCMDPICAQLCDADPNCNSYETTPAHRFCQLNSQGAANKMPYYGAETDNWGVPQDFIFCVKK